MENICRQFENITLTDKQNKIKYYFDKPKPNNLKYTETKMFLHDGTRVILTPNNKASKNRWKEIAYRPHVFYIKMTNYQGIVGRPPTWNEDFCPNCYEILPIELDYQNCSGCCQTVEHINTNRREICLIFHNANYF